MAAKAIIEKTKQLWIPDCVAEVLTDGGFERISYLKRDFRSDYKSVRRLDLANPTSGIGFIKGRQITFDRIELEKAEGDIRPDLVGYAGGAKLYIEIAVTHFVSTEKLAKILSRDISTIELDFSGDKLDWSWASLEERISTSSRNTKWLHNRKALLAARKDAQERNLRIGPVIAEQKLYETTHLVSISFTHYSGVLQLRLCPKALVICLDVSPGHPAKDIVIAEMVRRNAH